MALSRWQNTCIVRATSVSEIYYLGHYNKENERKNKNIKFSK